MPGCRSRGRAGGLQPMPGVAQRVPLERVSCGPRRRRMVEAQRTHHAPGDGGQAPFLEGRRGQARAHGPAPELPWDGPAHVEEPVFPWAGKLKTASPAGASLPEPSWSRQKETNEALEPSPSFLAEVQFLHPAERPPALDRAPRLAARRDLGREPRDAQPPGGGSARQEGTQCALAPREVGPNSCAGSFPPQGSSSTRRRRRRPSTSS